MYEEYTMIAKTFKGLENVLANELLQIGANNIQVQRRAVQFSGDKRLMYKANLWLRTASRVLKPVAVFQAQDADEVYDNIKHIDWEQYISCDSSIAIDSTVYSDTFKHSRYVTYRAKDAIVDFFMDRYGKRPSVKIDNPDLYINIHIAQTCVTVSLDSSGESLHKRGWRAEQTDAPINEALAAGMLLMAGWDGQRDFVDPMCGSGTFLIEAALIALNIPPGIYRERFAFERWKDFDAELFETLYNDDSSAREFKHHIYGSDHSFYAIRVAEKNIKNAGMQRYISLQQIAIQELKPQTESVLVVTNPPYGERIDPKNILQLYEEIGSTLKHKFTGSTAWIISSNEEALNRIGLKPSKKVPLLNGELECLFVRYDLFSGSHKDYKRKQNENTRH